MKKLKLIIIMATLIFFIGCGGNKNGEQAFKFDLSGYESVYFKSISISDGIEAFAIRQDGTIVCSGADEKTYIYNKDGEKKADLISEAFYGNFCTEDKNVYAYDYLKSAIVQWQEEELFANHARIIQNTISFHTIRNMVALDGKIYVLAIPFTSDNMDTFFPFGKEEFEYYGEILYEINAENSQYKTLNLKNIIAEYVSEDGRLFFYGWEEDKYYLYEYDQEKEKIAKKLSFDSMGNLLSMVVEGGYLFGISSSDGLFSIDLETGEKESQLPNLYAMFGNDLQFYHGNLYLNNTAEKEIQQVLAMDTNGKITLFAKGSEEIIENESTDKEESANHSSDENLADNDNSEKEDIEKTESKPKNRKEKINVSADGLSFLRTERIQQISGIRTKEIERSFDLEALIAELMAGNPDVDIYILPHAWPLTQRVRELELYEPLNDSKIITDYLEKCFPYIREAATNENKDIWMVPIYEYYNATWYIPGNMEKFGIQPEELCMFDSYLAVLERLHNKMGGYKYYNNADLFMDYCDTEYDMNYNNYQTGEINFDTDLYRHIAETLWTGWERYSSADANHPLFFRPNQEKGVMMMGETPDFDRNKVIFKTISMAEHLVYIIEPGSERFRELLEDWRVLPSPKLRSESEKNIVSLNYAYVNPYSKQKEVAVEYLETILENQVQLVKMPSFFREDLEYYEQYYNTSLPAFQDIYMIFKDSNVEYGYSWDFYDNYIRDYQQGLISFDEAIELRQKRAVTGLEE